MKRLVIACRCARCCRCIRARYAGEMFGGALRPRRQAADGSTAGIEGGADLSSAIAAARSATRTPLQPYVFGALNTAGETELRRGRPVGEVRQADLCPARLGLAVHNGSAGQLLPHRQDRVRQPRAVRARARHRCPINDRLSVEASWVHMSHATLFSHENPGIDNLGVRLNLAL